MSNSRIIVAVRGALLSPSKALNPSCTFGNISPKGEPICLQAHHYHYTDQIFRGSTTSLPHPRANCLPLTELALPKENDLFFRLGAESLGRLSNLHHSHARNIIERPITVLPLASPVWPSCDEPMPASWIKLYHSLTEVQSSYNESQFFLSCYWSVLSFSLRKEARYKLWSLPFAWMYWPMITGVGFGDGPVMRER